MRRRGRSVRRGRVSTGRGRGRQAQVPECFTIQHWQAAKHEAPSPHVVFSATPGIQCNTQNFVLGLVACLCCFLFVHCWLQSHLMIYISTS